MLSVTSAAETKNAQCLAQPAPCKLGPPQQPPGHKPSPSRASSGPPSPEHWEVGQGIRSVEASEVKVLF